MQLKQPIYFDMDGVLVNLDKFFIDNYGSTCLELGHDFVKEKLLQHAPNHFFQHLTPLHDFEDMKELMVTLKKKGHPVHILSSCTSYAVNHKIRDDKILWLKKHGIEENSEICDTHIIVPGSFMKAHYAPGILIDDWHEAGLPFKEAGGIWIEHVNHCDTVDQLVMLNVLWG